MSIEVRSRCIVFIITCLVNYSSISIASEDIPKPPDESHTPEPITFECVNAAKTFPALEICRQLAEAARETLEDYNAIVKDFCDSLVRVDGKLRKKAKEGKIEWDDYEDIKDEIVNQLNECDPNKGKFYASYRSRIREYKRLMNFIPKRKEAIVKGIGL